MAFYDGYDDDGKSTLDTYRIGYLRAFKLLMISRMSYLTSGQKSGWVRPDHDYVRLATTYFGRATNAKPFERTRARLAGVRVWLRQGSLP